MINKKLVLTAILAMSLVFSGCAANSGGNAKPDQTEKTSQGGDEEQIELRMTWWGSQTRHDLTTKVLELFESKHPNIKIKPEYSGWDGYFDKLSTQVAGANAPDLIQMDYAFLTDYANRGALLELDPYTASGELNKEHIDPSMIKAGSINDKLYAIALGVNAPGVAYSSAIFKELGIEDPKADWTWQDFSDIADKIAKAKGGGFVGAADISGTFQYF